MKKSICVFLILVVVSSAFGFVAALAAEIGISESSLRNKLKGRKDFTFSEFERIVEIFDLPWDYLFERTEAAG